MKALFLVTHSADCEKNWLSFESLGHETTVVVYDGTPHDGQGTFVERARHERPDLIIYVGAVERYHGRPVLQVDALKRLNEIAPLIHICGDGSDEPWWETLYEYDRAACFSAQVSIDGNPKTPIANFKNGIVKLTPTDPGLFADAPEWEARGISASIAGGYGLGERYGIVAELKGRGALKHFDARGSYCNMCAFVGNCRAQLNHPLRGSGGGYHVKGRVVEAGWAKAALFERANEVTRRWFTPGLDYAEYNDVHEAAALIERAVCFDLGLKVMGEKLHARVAAEHSPAIFWRDVMTVAFAERSDEAAA